MSGRPLIEFLLFALVWGILLIPLRAITKDEPEGDNTPTRQTSNLKTATTVWVQIRFTATPSSFTLYSHDKPVWEESDPSTQQEEPIELIWEDYAQGDMRLHAEWEDQIRRVTEVRLSMPNGPAKTCTIWHDEAVLQEALLFQ